MAKGKHHFVPKFYLSVFQSAPRQIHLYNLRTGLAVQDASLRDQCYRRKFYGQRDDTEDALAVLEDHAAAVLRSIRTQKVLPTAGTEEYVTLLAFVALQVLRTTTAASRTNVHVDKMIKQVFSGDPRLASADLEAVQFGYKDPVLASLRGLPHMLDAIADLRGHLAISTENSFLTSDNPAFRYNQYCEDSQHMGTTGALCRGFEIFIPLAPDLHLILYDGTTYKVRPLDRFSHRSGATQSDVDALNMIQLVSADEHVYFSDWRLTEHIRRLMQDITRHRLADPTVVVEYGQDDNPNRSLLHAFTHTPYLKLKLSFLKLKRRSRRVPLQDRIRDYRKTIPISLPPEPPDLRGRTVSFSRFLGQR